jgi:hypothetical protein
MVEDSVARLIIRTWEIRDLIDRRISNSTKSGLRLRMGRKITGPLSNTVVLLLGDPIAIAIRTRLRRR